MACHRCEHCRIVVDSQCGVPLTPRGRPGRRRAPPEPFRPTKQRSSSERQNLQRSVPFEPAVRQYAMRQYRLGEKVRLAAAYDSQGRPLPSVYRAEVTRPDGSSIERDWDKHDMRLRVDQVGTWTWRMYLREDGATRMQDGSFEVVAAGLSIPPAPGRRGLVRRILRRK